MTPLEWKIKRHRARVLDRFRTVRTASPAVQRYLWVRPLPVLERWKSVQRWQHARRVLLGDRYVPAFRHKLRELMRRNLSPIRFGDRD